MKTKISYLMIALASLATASCNREVLVSDSYGFLTLSMESDLSADVIVKSAEEDLVFCVDVKDATGKTVAHADDHRTVTTENPVRLQTGTYDVVATNGTNANAAFDNPFYQGSNSVKIIPDKISTVNLNCTLANTIFSVSFPDNFPEYFDVYEVTVTNGVGDPLVLSNSPQAGNANEAGFASEAYFAVTGTLSWELYLRNKDGGEYRMDNSYTDVKAKSHYHLTFELGEDDTADGALTIKITLNDSMSDSSYDVILDYDNRNVPAITSNEEFEATSGESISIPYGNTMPKVLTANTPEGLTSFRLTHSNATIGELGLPESVEFVGADAETESLLSSLGITATQVVGTKSITSGADGVSVDITGFIAKLPVGEYAMDFTTIDTKGHYTTFNLVFEIISDVDAEAVSATAGWAAFARLEGRFFKSPAPEGLSFQYKEASSSTWTDVPASEVSINSTSHRFTTIVKSLKPSTNYVFRAVSAKDKETKEIGFSTSSAETIHNLSFDEWSSSNKMPDAEGYKIWDSANSAGAAITTSPSDDAVKGKAARLESVVAYNMLASGNIFTGQFVGLSFSGGAGAKLNWGVPFSSRPLALRGYYKYTPVTIDRAKDPYADRKGQTDESQIVIFLTDWTAPFLVNTSSKDFVDLDNDPGIIALGQLNSSNTDSGYVKFTLPLTYRSNSRIPSYIVIAAASSRYGDYFTGGVGSVLLIDEFELIYDPAQLTDDEYNKVFSKVSEF